MIIQTFAPYSADRFSVAIIVRDTVRVARKIEISTRPITIQTIVISLETTSTGTFSPYLQQIKKDSNEAWPTLCQRNLKTEVWHWSFTMIRHEGGAFRECSSKRRSSAFRFRGDRKHWESGASRKIWRLDNYVIMISSLVFSSNTNPKCPMNVRKTFEAFVE